MEGITSRHVLVTGAAGGIGAAVAAAFEANGAHVTRLDLRAAGGAEICDVTDEVAVARAFAAVAPLDHVVHAAGIVAVGRVADTNADEFRRVLEANAVGSFVVAREAGRWLQHGGTLTLIASQAGRKGAAGWAAYCASKFAVVGLGESLAQELAPGGIRVNVLCPGTIDTAMAERAIGEVAGMRGTSSEEERESYRRNVPLGRLGTPEDVAGACILLASPLAGFIAGASIVVDGGELS
jgi:meso-butanediol dehydrogenase/(S,S)-butanediol dehydrogenase/diacetyl reductase